jgi:hypothetical protein
MVLMAMLKRSRSSTTIVTWAHLAGFKKLVQGPHSSLSDVDSVLTKQIQLRALGTTSSTPVGDGRLRIVARFYTRDTWRFVSHEGLSVRRWCSTSSPWIRARASGCGASGMRKVFCSNQLSIIASDTSAITLGFTSASSALATQITSGCGFFVSRDTLSVKQSRTPGEFAGFALI